jgi:hypothetical protein
MSQADEFLAEYPPHIQAISQQLRKIIKNALPDATEKVYLGWRGLGFRHPKAGYFGCIFPFSDKVNLAFEHGVHLDDPDHLLIPAPTSSKQVRYLEIRTDADIDEDIIVGFLHAAIALKSS